MVKLQRESQSDSFWNLRLAVSTITTSNAIISTYCNDSEWLHYVWVNWIATLRTDVVFNFFDFTFSPVISSSNNNVIQSLSMTLPSNPIVQAYLTGWAITSTSWRIAIYTNVHSFDTSANTVSLNFTIAQTNTWT